MRKNYITLLLGLLLSHVMISQTTLYSEDFTGQNGKGIIGAAFGGSNTDLSGVDWTIDVSSANIGANFFGGNEDYFYVNNESFSAKDTDGNAYWFSPSIAITGYTNVSFSLDASTSGNNDNTDTFLTQYRINGGTWTTAATNGNLNNDFNLVVSQNGLSGNTLEIRIRVNNNADNEITTFDNVLVVGTFPCTTTPSDVTSLTATTDDSEINLNWTDSLCFDEVLVVAKSGSAVTATPSGNGSLYTANSSFGLGTEIASGEFVVYKGIGNSVLTTNLTNGTTYHFEVFTRKGSNWSAGVIVNAIPNLNYCVIDPVATGGAYETSISRVVFGSIDNSTPLKPANGPGYQDYTAQSTNVTKGASTNLSVQIDTDGNYNVYTYAWIDWNQDGDFDDSGEAYDLGNTLNSDPYGTSTFFTDNSPLSILVPTSAAIGHTRLRILCQYYSGAAPTNGPCDGSTDGEVEDYSVNVTGSITYTYNNGWTPSDPNSIATTVDVLNIENGNATISSNTSCNTATVSAGAGLTIDSGVTFTTNNLSLESSSTSYSSLMVDGTVSGNVSYERHVNIQSGGNDLISAPVSGQTFGSFATANSNIFENPSNPSQKLFGPWSKVTNEYLTYDTDVPAEANVILDAATGYRAASSDNGTFTFTGTVNTGTITKDLIYSGPHETEWNLVGNPYPSYINVQDFLNHDLGGGVTNLQLFNSVTAAIYGYDGNASDGWVIYNLATTTASTVIAPGQGFFVSADPTKVAAYDLEFTPAMQSTGTGDDFISGRTSELTYLKLNLNNAAEGYHTDFYFNSNASEGFDYGYDAVVWGGNAPEFSVYSKLVQDDSDNVLALQALNLTDVSNIVIPLGVNASQGEQITFSIAESTIPNSVNVYLEDTLTNTSTLLNTSDYVLTPSTTLSGTGRFFLRFSEDALSTTENSFENIQIYSTKTPKTLFIKGQLSADTTIKIYDIQGRLISNSVVDYRSTSNQIDITSMVSGIYLVTLDNGLHQYSKKVMID